MTSHGGIEGVHDAAAGGYGGFELDPSGDDALAPRAGGSRFAGHRAVDALSRRGGAVTGRLTPMFSRAIIDGAYLRAMLGNLYFALPAAGLALGIAAGISTSGNAVPPALWLTLVLIALGAMDAFSGLLAITGFAAVTLVTGNLVGPHMLHAPPGQQPAVYTLTGLFALGVMWFAGAQVPRRFRPLRAHRTGSEIWLRRLSDYVVIPFLGTIVIWAVAAEMPTLTGWGPQELFVTIQNHDFDVKCVAFVAILARVLFQSIADHHFRARTHASVPDPVGQRPLVLSVLFFFIRCAFVFMLVWEFLGLGWMTWAVLGLYAAIEVAAWVGRNLPPVRLLSTWLRLTVVRVVLVVVFAEFLMSQITHHLVNPVPMLGALLIGIGIALVVLVFVEELSEPRRAKGWSSGLVDLALIVLLIVIFQGVIRINATPFADPHGVLVAPTGAVFVADTDNNRVVLVEKDGYRETIGVGLSHPADVAADGSGYVYIADAGNNRIVRLWGYRRYSVGSRTFDLALADGATSQVSLGVGLKDPQSVAVNGLGNVYVADTGNGRIVEINRVTGAQRTVLKGLVHPLAVLCDPRYTETYWVADSGAGTVIQMLPNGHQSVLMNHLHDPAGLGMDLDHNLYVSEYASGDVLRLDLNHASADYGRTTVVATGLDHPRGISVDAEGDVFVAVAGGGQVEVFATLREHELMTHGLPDPSAVAASRSGAVYITERRAGTVQEYVDGVLSTIATGLRAPVGVAAGAAGTVWVDERDGALLLVSPNGTYRVVAQGLDRPRQLWAVNGGTAVLVAEAGSNRIVEFGTGGASDVLEAGLPSPVAVAEGATGTLAIGLGDGDVYELPRNGASRYLFSVHGICAIGIDDANNIYVASSRYRLVIEHNADTGADVVVNRDFRSIAGMTTTARGVLWVVDRTSNALYQVPQTRLTVQL